MAGDDSLLEGNRAYAERGVGELPPLPRRGLVVLTCMDHRIDPAAALGLDLGDAMVLRNPGGRVTPQVIEDLQTLDRIARARDASLADLELVLMQHTLCGANALTSTEPREAARADLETLANDPSIPGSVSVTVLLYDTETGRVELVERRDALREES